MRLIVIFALATFCCSVYADSKMYKCVSASGAITFQQAICDEDRKTVPSAPTVSNSGASENGDVGFTDPCGGVSSCLVDSWFSVAEYKCPALIERLARWDLEWTDSFTELKFVANPVIVNDSVIRFYGDKLRLQNGFGAWTNVIYSCDINIEHKTIVDVNAVSGRLR